MQQKTRAPLSICVAGNMNKRTILAGNVNKRTILAGKIAGKVNKRTPQKMELRRQDKESLANKFTS